MDVIEQELGRSPGFYVGVDLAMMRDYSALVVCRKHVDGFGDVIHAICYAHRFKRGVRYTDIVPALVDFVDELPPMPDSPAVFVDRTGVGIGVVDSLRKAGLKCWGVNLGGGTDWHFSPTPGVIQLSKALLVSTMSIAFQARRVVIAGDLPELRVLQRELATFTLKMSDAGNETFSAAGAGYDDMVISLGLAMFGATRYWGPPKTVIL